MAKYYAQIMVEVIASDDDEAIEISKQVSRNINKANGSVWPSQLNYVTKTAGLMERKDIFDWEKDAQ